MTGGRKMRPRSGLVEGWWSGRAGGAARPSPAPGSAFTHSSSTPTAPTRRRCPLSTLELAQQGYAAWREVPWTDLSRGMGSSQEQLATDEGHLRVFWRKWDEMMGARA